MDIVFIEGLKIDTTIGYYDWEKTIKQPLIFDLQMGCDIRLAAAGDELHKTVNYADVAADIELIAQEKVVDLLETLAENMAQRLMQKYAISWLRLKINKPQAVANAQGVGVIIERGSKG
ncbi:dihydroneopterin aldolase [Thalassotalea ponticola]|uniref:dihydroneopterin aldolase n=1 Tax=Thalassotalea ponticola TaxID=1523392 RepID=UPI0025B598E8|nr:dihydroneopterin aldolase [Thalassotalea ponticola]MDN3651967.1 dihydroneopterin aldolase [Thalassotalea ponticola]